MDCLKKYTERRVEVRRHTETSATSEFDTGNWLPLPNTINREHKSSELSRKRIELMNTMTTYKPTSGGRSYSTDINMFRKDKRIEHRRNTDMIPAR